MGRNFSNKIWNAYRFLQMNLDELDTDFEKYEEHFELSDRWILSSFQRTVEQASWQLDSYKVNESLNTIYQFFWHDYCDWYLELIKNRLYNKENSLAHKTALSIATYIMKETMSLLHPFIPFISEEVWQSLKKPNEESIVISNWPEVKQAFKDDLSEQTMQFLQAAISAIRNIRAEMNVPPGKMAQLYVQADDSTKNTIYQHAMYFKSLAKIEKIQSYTDTLKDVAKATAVVNNTELFVPLAELIDLNKEKERLEKEINRLQGLQKGISAKLSNQQFVTKAPAQVVKAEEDKLAKIVESLEKIEKNYNNLTRK
jgi:valyl-tRNA synthetase